MRTSYTIETHRFGKYCALHVVTKESGQIWYHIKDVDGEGIVLDGSEMDTLVQIYLKRKEGKE